MAGEDVPAENGGVGLDDGGVDGESREEEGGEDGELHFGCLGVWVDEDVDGIKAGELVVAEKWDVVKEKTGRRLVK